MNLNVADKWVAALKSGEYKQGRGALRTDDKYCCLGVLCDLAVKEGIIGPPESLGGSYFYGDNALWQGSSATLPESVREWAGMKSHVGGFRDDGHRTLTAYNDGTGNISTTSSFEEIAEIIKENVDVL